MIIESRRATDFKNTVFALSEFVDVVVGSIVLTPWSIVLMFGQLPSISSLCPLP